jgi:hypothetical protein
MASRLTIAGARMGQPAAKRPVDRTKVTEIPQRMGWPEGAPAQSEALHRLLTINDRQWHALKAQPCRRAAEQLAGALVQLIAADGPQASLDSDGRQRAISLTRSALAWLEGELRDPGCPTHGR